MGKGLTLVFLAAFGSCMFSAGGAWGQDSPAKPLRALILTGRHNHDWQATTAYLKKMYEASGRFSVDVTEDPASLDAAALAPYDALVSNWAAYPEVTGRQWGETAEKAVADFVRGGKGFVLFHAAVATFVDWPEFVEMAGCTWGEKSGHGRRHRFNIEFVNTDHPITRGLPNFSTARDELYHSLDPHPPFELLARTYSTKNTRGTGRYEPMAHVKNFGAGRCFYTALGHDVEAMEGVGFQALMLRGTEWAATGKVTFAAPDNLPPERLQAVVVTGGHDFDAEAFPKLFGDPDEVLYEYAQQEDDSEIFEDISDWPHDVIVLYNMTQRISEKRRANFLALLERGVGLVALHHAIAAYQEWPEFQKILGAWYYLKDTTVDGVTRPKSTYEHDVDFALHIADPSHPVTAGLQDFQVHDETYNGIDYDPGNHVLIMTDHPTSSGPIAWARTHGAARVCFIQVGHGPQVFTQPEYQQLVRQAILWAGQSEP